jgi:hypothetical protein
MRFRFAIFVFLGRFLLDDGNEGRRTGEVEVWIVQVLHDEVDILWDIGDVALAEDLFGTVGSSLFHGEWLELRYEGGGKRDWGGTAKGEGRDRENEMRLGLFEGVRVQSHEKRDKITFAENLNYIRVRSQDQKQLDNSGQ